MKSPLAPRCRYYILQEPLLGGRRLQDLLEFISARHALLQRHARLLQLHHQPKQTHPSCCAFGFVDDVSPEPRGSRPPCSGSSAFSVADASPSAPCCALGIDDERVDLSFISILPSAASLCSPSSAISI